MGSSQHLSVSPIAGALGAEVDGVQLAHLNEAAFTEVQAAFLERQVLLFRDQELTRDQQRAFARRALLFRCGDRPPRLSASM